MKKLTAIVVIALFLSITPVFATYSGGTGEPNDPYQIANVADLLTLANDTNDYNKCFVLTANINLTGLTFTQAPIAPDTIIDSDQSFNGTSFTGIFDGNNHTISNLTVSASTRDYIGLFGCVGTGSQIKNLGVVNANINGKNRIGGLVGFNCGTVSESYVTGSVRGHYTNYYIGGLCGINSSTGSIISCYSTSSVWYCYKYAGGLVGENSGIISNCYATGSVWGDGEVGGLCGSNYITGTITMCYATGWVTANYDWAGGLCGEAYSGGSIITACFWDIQTSGQTTTVGSGTGRTTAQMKDIQTYLNAGWTFIHGTTKVGDWVIPDNSYPKQAWQVYTPVTIPNLRGLTEEQARIALDAAGLLCGDIYSVYDVSIAAGLVSETQPTSGTTAYAGLTPVHILLAKETKYAGGDGIITPYQIATVDHWFDIINNPTDWNKSFILTADINLNGINFTQSPIAPDSNSTTSGFQGIQFTGVFDGKGYTISNLNITAPDKDYVGIFGYVGPGGQIKNLGLENVSIHARGYVGGLAGYNDYGAITNCYNSGTIGAAGQYIGGLVGWNYYGKIAFCYTTGPVAGISGVGGLSGRNTGQIKNCYSVGSVLVINEYSNAGGLCGENDSSISCCYATGSVSGLGGESKIGGLVGYDHGTITSSYATGRVTVGGTWNYTGGLVGYRSTNITSNCFWDIETTGQIYSGVGTGKTTAEMKDIQTYLNADWAFIRGPVTVGDWVMPDDSYPELAMEFYTPVTIPNLKGLTEQQAIEALDTAGLIYGETYFVYDTSIAAGLVSQTFPEFGSMVYAEVSPVIILLAKETKYAGGDGVTTPYQIANIDHWFDIINNPADWNKSFILTADIDLNGISFTQSPIAPDNNSTTSNFQGIPFTGIFDGFGHTISNLMITAPGKDFIGLFGSVGTGGQIENLELKNVSIKGRGYVGGIVGRNYGSIFSCLVTGTISGSNSTYGYVGGLVGYHYQGTITSCYVTGAVKGYYVGGLVGGNDQGTITSCSMNGEVNGCYYVGGLLGNNYYGQVTSCYATGEVSGSGNIVGGLLGNNYFGQVTSCYATGSVSGGDTVGGLLGYNLGGTVTSCYATGEVSGSGNIVGGLVGINENYGSISSSYFLITSGPDNGLGTPLTDEQMKQQASFVWWDFSDTDGDAADWMMLRESEDYPRLAWQTIYPGDIAGLYGVNLVDYAVFANAWFSTPADANWNPLCDLYPDNVIDILDLQIFIEHWLTGL